MADWDALLPSGRPRPVEVRSDLSGGRIARVIYSLVGGEMILLHGFEKKTQKTPRHGIELALMRKREIAK